MATVSPTTMNDERLPAFRTLLSPAAGEMLGAAVAQPALRVTAKQVQWLPGRSLTVVYETSMAKGIEGHLVATTGDALPPGAAVLQRGEERVAAWRLANDPALPGLAVAMNSERLGRVLDDLGVSPGSVSTRLRSYRPGRRAVVEAQRGRHRLFIKIVRPEQTAALQQRHAAFAEVMPVPRSHGWSAEHGIVVLEALGGATLRETLDTAKAGLPDPSALEAMLELIPALDGGRESGGSLATARQHSELLRRIVPELSDRLDSFLEGLADAGDNGPLVPVHGDLHDAQLMVENGRLTGILDVDTAGMGHRVDDWAGMIGHLSARMQAAPEPLRSRLAGYGGSVLALAETRCQRRALRARVAAVVLGVATGPFRVQSPAWVSETRARFGLAEEWLAGQQEMRRLSPRSQSPLMRG